MFSILEKIVDKLSIKLGLFNRNNSSLFKQTRGDHAGDNVAGDKVVYNNTNQGAKDASLIYFWSTKEHCEENGEILECEFSLTLQNKSEEILRDIWVNFSSSGFKLQLVPTKQTILFEGWNFYNQALNLLTKEDYKCAPQSFLSPFTIHITLNKNSLPENAWLYFSYGSPNVKKVEKEGRVKKEELLAFISSKNRNSKLFLNILRLGQ